MLCLIAEMFRGCADPWNLPWGIDPDPGSNCRQQNDKSIWWFCEGELCNDGQIDQQSRYETTAKRAPPQSVKGHNGVLYCFPFYTIIDIFLALY